MSVFSFLLHGRVSSYIEVFIVAQKGKSTSTALKISFSYQSYCLNYISLKSETRHIFLNIII